MLQDGAGCRMETEGGREDGRESSGREFPCRVKHLFLETSSTFIFFLTLHDDQGWKKRRKKTKVITDRQRSATQHNKTHKTTLLGKGGGNLHKKLSQDGNTIPS